MVAARQIWQAEHPEVFVALDFETADFGPDSACALALVRVEGGVVVERRQWLIRPPRSTFAFTHVHGITWTDVEAAPTFARVWAEARPMLEGADYLAAHNASFDRRVLAACCSAAGLEMPALAFLCTLRLSRQTWALEHHRLPDVAGHLGISLARHHEALADAQACAGIVLAGQGARGASWSARAFFVGDNAFRNDSGGIAEGS